MTDTKAPSADELGERVRVVLSMLERDARAVSNLGKWQTDNNYGRAWSTVSALAARLEGLEQIIEAEQIAEGSHVPCASCGLPGPREMMAEVTELQRGSDESAFVDVRICGSCLAAKAAGTMDAVMGCRIAPTTPDSGGEGEEVAVRYVIAPTLQSGQELARDRGLPITTPILCHAEQIRGLDLSRPEFAVVPPSNTAWYRAAEGFATEVQMMLARPLLSDTPDDEVGEACDHDWGEWREGGSVCRNFRYCMKCATWQPKPDPQAHYGAKPARVDAGGELHVYGCDECGDVLVERAGLSPLCGDCNKAMALIDRAESCGREDCPIENCAWPQCGCKLSNKPVRGGRSDEPTMPAHLWPKDE